jgi:dipeptidyl aminopeptidase/acylaminoacyl peptidase
LVPVENSLLYAKSLRENNIPFEMHIYPDGPHGMSCVSDETYWEIPKFTRKYPWIKQSIEWLYLVFGLTKIEKE